jgi:hypothetical protein
VNEGTLDPQFFFSSDKAWFYLNGHVNTHNNQYWFLETPWVFMKHHFMIWKLVFGVESVQGKQLALFFYGYT